MDSDTGFITVYITYLVKGIVFCSVETVGRMLGETTLTYVKRNAKVGHQPISSLGTDMIDGIDALIDNEPDSIPFPGP